MPRVGPGASKPSGHELTCIGRRTAGANQSFEPERPTARLHREVPRSRRIESWREAPNELEGLVGRERSQLDRRAAVIRDDLRE